MPKRKNSKWAENMRYQEDLMSMSMTTMEKSRQSKLEQQTNEAKKNRNLFSDPDVSKTYKNAMRTSSELKNYLEVYNDPTMKVAAPTRNIDYAKTPMSDYKDIRKLQKQLYAN